MQIIYGQEHSMFIAALFVETGGCYFGLPNVDPWDESRDARAYSGPHPVVAHPPCERWGRFAKVNYIRWGGEHNRPGNDDGCFSSALQAVKKWGGVLEHPAFTDAWSSFGLPRPEFGQWIFSDGVWVTEVWQSAYGHKARKRTWLLYCGALPPPDLLWETPEGTHQIGGHDKRGKSRNKPTISGKKARATPIAFRDELISIAINCRNIV